ncbi:TonB C-terminal domain-containing protein [Variovorax sp. dw_308]|uniref:TonB C-terminal domain-containing protein n=1 Tax=Variovorax sp. dw_308 TaxID=2721546 RepID=UPI001C45EA93|nr:TonB C-terminal domain-containing protein [Variovorax sp. dw_308]
MKTLVLLLALWSATTCAIAQESTEAKAQELARLRAQIQERLQEPLDKAPGPRRRGKYVVYGGTAADTSYAAWLRGTYCRIVAVHASLNAPGSLPKGPGRGRLMLTVERSGDLQAASMPVSLGDARLDDSVIAAASRAAPFPPPPPESDGKVDLLWTDAVIVYGNDGLGAPDECAAEVQPGALRFADRDSRSAGACYAKGLPAARTDEDLRSLVSRCGDERGYFAALRQLNALPLPKAATLRLRPAGQEQNTVRVSLEADVFFNLHQTRTLPIGFEKLDQLIARLGKETRVEAIRIAGGSDSYEAALGDGEHLARARAEMVRAYLASAGLDSATPVAVTRREGYGPFTAEGRARDRSARITVQAIGERP